VLLGATMLNGPDLGDQLASLARAHQLVPHSVGLNARVSGAGVALTEAGGQEREPLVTLGVDGSVMASFSVAGDDQFFGSMRVDPDRLHAGITRAGAFARAAWELLDEREAVQQVAVGASIMGAQSKVFGAPTGRNSLQMGSHSLPATVVVPEPARVIRRADVGSADVAQRLVAEVRRVFADAGAVES
jgi:hypothetical protein